MTRRLGLVGLATGLLLVTTTATATVAGTDLPHPAHIHSGLCPAPGEVLAPLSDVTEDLLVGDAVGGGLPVGAGSAIPVQGSVTTVPLSLSDLVAADHSIVIHAGHADMATYLACGDIGGRAIDGTDLAVGIRALGDGGLSGIAWLSDQGDGSTIVRLFVTVAPASGPAPVTSPAPSTSPSAPVAQTISLAGSVYFAGFQIDATSATHDPVAGTVAIDATITSFATVPRSPLELAVSGNSYLARGTQSYQLAYEASGNVPAASTIVVRIVADVPQDFVMSESVLTFGQPIDHQATLPLVEGATGTSQFPVEVEARARARHRGVVTVQVLGAEIINAGCDGRPEALTFLPLRADQQSLLLTVNERSGPTGATVSSFATGPGGISAQGTPGGTPIIGPRTTNQRVRYCYTLPAPIQGEYRITLQSAATRIPTRNTRFTIDVP